jgi:hypothetical protein
VAKASARLRGSGDDVFISSFLIYSWQEFWMLTLPARVFQKCSFFRILMAPAGELFFFGGNVKASVIKTKT